MFLGDGGAVDRELDEWVLGVFEGDPVVIGVLVEVKVFGFTGDGEAAEKAGWKRNMGQAMAGWFPSSGINAR